MKYSSVMGIGRKTADRQSTVVNAEKAESRNMKRTIDIAYNKCDWGNNLYIEDVTYIENCKQCVRSTLMEIDPTELEEKYVSIYNYTEGLAMFRERPITPLNILEVSISADIPENYWMMDVKEDRYDHTAMIQSQKQYYRDMEEWGNRINE